MEQKKKILYFDMDNVIVDFQSGIDNLSDAIKKEYEGRLDEVPNIFSYMKPVQGAVEAVKLLAKYFDVYILSTCPWKNITGASQKIEWVKKYFGFDGENVFYKRVILSHHKNLNKGDYLIDDRTKNGADKFEGELIQFGSEKFPNWETVKKYLFEKENIYSIIFKEENDKFMEMFNKLSPRDKCKFTGDDPHDFYTPEEEAAFQIEISEGSERLKERETFKKLDAIIAERKLKETEKSYEYYIFMKHRLARRIGFTKCEWLINGEWKEDRQRTLALNDALMDYGDYSIFDQDLITPEIAEALIQNGTIVLQGDIGFGTIYREPKTIQLSNWKKPDSLK